MGKKSLRSFKTLILSLIFSLSVSNCYADTDIVELQPNQLAPFHGLLFTPEKANSIKAQLLDGDLYKQLSESQQHSIDILKQNMDLSEKKVSMLLDQNDKLSESLKSAQGMNNLERIGLVVLGVVMTVGAGLAIRKASQ